MKKKLAIINSSSKECSHGGVAPFMKNMHDFLDKEFDVHYFYLPDTWKFGLGRLNLILYLTGRMPCIKQFDFIISHVPEGSYIISFFKVPYAHIYHGNDNPMTLSKYWFGKYFAFVFDVFYKRIKKTCALQYTVGPSFGKIKKILNPINHKIKIKSSEQKSGFIFAGRLHPAKRIDKLIMIYSKLPAIIQAKNHLFIAGRGNEDKKLKDLVAQYSLTDNIHFLGSLSNEELIEEVSSKKIFLMASEKEGLPTAIAEALSVSVPVVSTNPGDIGLVLKNNYNGFIFPLDFQDSDYIDAIENILSDYERFAKNAKASAAVFDGESITKGVIQDINNII